MEFSGTSGIIIQILLAMPLIAECAGIPYGNRHHFIESPKWSRWGVWGKLEHCPSDQVVVGMRLKVHGNQGVKDDTGLNAVKFYCQNPYTTAEYSEDVVSITSLVGEYGEWKNDFFCPAAGAPSPGTTGALDNKLIAVGFQLRSETSSGVKDDTAGNNLKLVCSDLYQKQGYTYLEGDGTQRGEWTERQLCWPGYAICGLQTQVETGRSIDTTGLNNMKVRCCRVDSGYSFQTAMSNVSIPGHHSHSGETSSSSSGESSASAEKGREAMHEEGDAQEHNHHRGDHTNSEEESGEGEQIHGGILEESREEQELVAIVDPEPTKEDQEPEAVDEFQITATNQPETHTETRQSLSEIFSGIDMGEDKQSSLSEEDDDTLPEDIARIDQVDNSEAHHEEEENVSTVADSQQHIIPEEVVNALEDADADNTESFSNQNDDDDHQIHQHTHPNNDKSFHWGNEVTNTTALQGAVPGMSVEDVNNSLEEPEPKSSPRFGKINTNGTVVLDGLNHASAFTSQSSGKWQALSVGSLVILYNFLKGF